MKQCNSIKGWIDINDRLPNPENGFWYHLKISPVRISEDMKQTVMELEHFIREMNYGLLCLNAKRMAR